MDARGSGETSADSTVCDRETGTENTGVGGWESRGDTSLSGDDAGGTLGAPLCSVTSNMLHGFFFATYIIMIECLC